MASAREQAREAGQEFADVRGRYIPHKEANGVADAASDVWEPIVRDLRDALLSFMAYDGHGWERAEDGNRGDWGAAERAIARAKEALDG